MLLVVRASAGQVLLSRRGIAVVVAAPAGFALMRNNALPVVLVILALMVWWSRAHLRRALVVSAVTLVIIVVPTAATAQSQHAKEALGIPLQMIGYTLVHDADCLPPASRQVFDNVLEPEVWKQVYRPASVDPTKDSATFNNTYLDTHRGQFLSAWGRALVACPRPFVTGFLVHTANLWRFDADPISTDGQSRFISAVSNYPAGRDQLIRDYANAGVVNLDVGDGTERGRVHLRRAARVGGDLCTRDPAVGDAPDRGAHRHTVPLHGARHHGGADRPRRPAGHRPSHLGAGTVEQCAFPQESQS